MGARQAEGVLNRASLARVNTDFHSICLFFLFLVVLPFAQHEFGAKNRVLRAGRGAWVFAGNSTKSAQKWANAPFVDNQSAISRILGG